MLRKSLYLGACILALFLLTLANPAMADTYDKKVGILFGSYGDVDHPSEVRELVTNVVRDPDIVPLPGAVRGLFAQMGWQQRKKGILSEYAAIGGATNMRANAEAQADLAAEFLRNRGYDATGYTGFTMTFPYIEDTLDQIRQDGVEQLVVFYQGAQYSQVTAYIVFREVEKYLNEHPMWDVSVTGVKSFSDDPRFTDLIVDKIEKRMDSSFPGVDASDVCVFLPAHGNLLHWIDRGDPSYEQMLRVFDTVAQAFPDSYVTYGFQNHDEISFTKWTMPNTDGALDLLANQPCHHVIINGMVSFTVGSLETLYDHGVAEVAYLAERSAYYGHEKEIVVEGVFDDDPGFAELLADLAVEALDGRGDITPIGNGAVQALSLR